MTAPSSLLALIMQSSCVRKKEEFSWEETTLTTALAVETQKARL